MGIPQCEHTETVLNRWMCHVCQSMGLRSPIEGEAPRSKEAVAACPHMEELPVCTRDAMTSSIDSHVATSANFRSDSSALYGTPYAAASSSDARCLDFSAAARGGSESHNSTLGRSESTGSDFAAASTSGGRPHNSVAADVEHTPAPASPSHASVSADVPVAADASSRGDVHHALPASTCAEADVGHTESHVAPICKTKIQTGASIKEADANACVAGLDDGRCPTAVPADTDFATPHSSFAVTDADSSTAGVPDDSAQQATASEPAGDSNAPGVDSDCDTSVQLRAEAGCIAFCGDADCRREDPAALYLAGPEDASCTLPSSAGDCSVGSSSGPSARLDAVEIDFNTALDGDTGSQHSALDLTMKTDSSVAAVAQNPCQSFISVDGEYAAPSSAFNLGDMDFNIAAFQDDNSQTSRSLQANDKECVAPESQRVTSVDSEHPAPRNGFASYDLFDMVSSNMDIAENCKHNLAADSNFADSIPGGLIDSSCDIFTSADAEYASPRNRFSSFDLVDLDLSNPSVAEDKSVDAVGVDCADSRVAAMRPADNDHVRSLEGDHTAIRNRFCSFDFVDLDSNDALAAQKSNQTSVSASPDYGDSSVIDGAEKDNHLSASVDLVVEDADSNTNDVNSSGCQDFTSTDAEHASPRNRFSSFDLVDLDSGNAVVEDSHCRSSASTNNECPDDSVDVVDNSVDIAVVKTNDRSVIADNVDTDFRVADVDDRSSGLQARRETTVRHIFLVRHVQSQWNVMMKAFKDVDIRGMYDSATAVEGVDHPLSEEGLRQAEELQSKIQSWRAPTESACPDSDRVQAFYEAFYLAKRSEILCSPQRRAVQTADRTLPVADGWPSIKLIQEARELKNHMFEFDNVSTEDNIGEQIAVNAGLASHAGRVDSSECTDRWWPEGVDSDDQREVRAKALWRRLEELKSRSCVVVTHSNLIKQLANFIIRSRILDREVDACGSDQWDFCIVPKIPEDLERARSSKLRNGGVLGLQCRFEMPDADCPSAQTSLTVEDALLMFESEFEDAPYTAAVSA
mmetsp:Transcript_3119/g.5411  ORF Transcript_3119/g.5411 Transcript_3119/m.5411 type:complete len:1031 (-) Transcript_3119:98-3190(-)